MVVQVFMGPGLDAGLETVSDEFKPVKITI